MARDIYLSDDRYIAALKRQRDRIAAGLEFWKFDSDEPGAKDTQASWGLCASDAETWPEDADRLFPTMPGRYEAKYRNPPHKCPMDGRDGVQGGSGCFSRCAIFKRKVRAEDREAAVARYDALIAKVTAIAAGRGEG